MSKITIEPGLGITVQDEGTVLAHLRTIASEPKTCVHPLATPSGRVISGFEPSDHRWHRGLWFTLKYVDDDNFWEEDDSTGIQVSLGQENVSVEPDGSTLIEQSIHYRRPNGEDAISEKRVLRIEHDSDAVRVDWNGQLNVLEDVYLDRTPFTTYGGYAGLGLRTCRELHAVRFVSPEGEHEGVYGDRHPWLACDGLLDGPFVDGQAAAAGVLMVVDGEHPRFPVPFYAKSGGGFTFMNPAFLFHEGLDVKKGDVLDLNYRIVTVDGRWGDNLKAEVAKAGEAFQ